MKIISRINTKIPYKIVVKSFSNVYTEANKNYITMTAASFGLNSLYLVIAEDITVPNGRIFSGFYNDGTTSYMEIRNADGSAFNGVVSFTALAFGA